jgi:thiol-disulfide isomerase/thioredoxin
MTHAQGEPPAKDAENPFPRRVQAPTLDGGLAWLNSAGPIELAKLRGKIVLLDFWTYCCINCIQILPDLTKLEKEFENELVVIGVHSAKFDGEKDTENIRDAIMRYEIKHPVVNDGRMNRWRRFQVNAWPTQLLIDPEGKVIGSASGEGNYEVIRDAVKKLIAYHEKKGTLDRTPLHFQLESFGQESTPLRYPGKILADAATGRLFIADSGYHRVIIVDAATLQMKEIIGTGQAGLVDGSFDKAQFFEPQGMALAGNFLYLADRRNHVIRRLDLAQRTVETMAGVGKQGWEREANGPAKDIPLASPWDLLIHENELYIAMAGTHQIWSMDLAKGTVGPYAGSGRENISDGGWQDATFAQPSGLSTDGKSLFVADSETSSVRRISFADHTVETVVGQGLFEFGDVDGKGSEVRLQHALGVLYHDGKLFVADTYNNKLKTIDPRTTETSSYLGDGKGELRDDPPRFDEPSGLAILGQTLYVADTNNHAIRAVDLTSKKVSTLVFQGLKPPATPDDDDALPTGPTRELTPVKLDPSKETAVRATVPVADGQKLNDRAPMSYRVDLVAENVGGRKTITRGRLEEVAATVSFQIPPVEADPPAHLEISVVYFPCETGSEGVCKIATQAWKVPLAGEAPLVGTLELSP